MNRERTLPDESRNLGGLLVAFVLVGFPIGSTAAAVADPAGYPFGLSMTETVLVAGAVPIALAEATGNRPDALQSVAFFVAFVVTQIPALLVVELAFEGGAAVVSRPAVRAAGRVRPRLPVGACRDGPAVPCGARTADVDPRRRRTGGTSLTAHSRSRTRICTGFRGRAVMVATRSSSGEETSSR
ncbi:hypothetical protein [Halosimplex pelagicum]|uniref:Uncharacterized protein n=1 Tax=Halosimplex pelagicum TaxID=869886 RepID=A0A7D5PFP0_9EURY|nr:hypothetical protein [Halosimplex pelagicum]QLH83540.1 hypothetical protein HZS54_18730 [Halosimplex pelagicum]